MKNRNSSHRKSSRTRWKVTVAVLRIAMGFLAVLYILPHYLVWKKTRQQNLHQQQHQQQNKRSSAEQNKMRSKTWDSKMSKNKTRQQQQPTIYKTINRTTTRTRSQASAAVLVETVDFAAINKRRGTVAHGTEAMQSSSNARTQAQQYVLCFNGTTHERLLQAPDLIIAGTQKAGTTALYALLRKHPQMVPSSLFEAHFFDMHYGTLREQLEHKKGIHGEALHCRIHKAYLERLNLSILNNQTLTTATPPRFWTFEKTPNYMIWPHVPAAIVATCPWKPRILMVLRNPVDRLYSQYQMQFVQQAGMPNLETALDRELQVLRNFGLTLAPNVTEWLPQKGGNENTAAITTLPSSPFRPPPISNKDRNAKDSIRFRGFGNHGSNPRYLQRGMYLYQLQRWLQHFDRDTELLVLPYERLRNDMRSVWYEILDFVGAPRFHLSTAELQATYRPSLDADNRHEMPPAAPLSNDTRAYLVEFYRPYNALLADLLGDEWRGIWDT